jgi:hypothetical protein
MEFLKKRYNALTEEQIHEYNRRAALAMLLCVMVYSASKGGTKAALSTFQRDFVEEAADIAAQIVKANA